MPRSGSFAMPCALLALVACGDSLVLPSEGEPKQVTVQSGAGQQATVGGTVAESLVVRITDAVGRPVAQLAMSVNLPFGGAISPAGLQTDDDGRVAFTWTLGPAAGPQTIEVGTGDPAHLDPKAVISAMADPGAPESLTVLQGDQQTGQTDTQLAESLVVRVTDGFGNHLAGIPLTWNSSAGTISPPQLITDATGRAACAWTLGPAPGTQTATIVVSADSAISVPFSATATPGPSPILAIVTQPSDTVQSGAPFGTQPAIQLEDANGAPLALAGVTVTAAVASGSASLGGTALRQTDNAGLATFTNLSLSGPSGPATLIFATSGYVSITSQQVVVGFRVPSPTQSTVAVAPNTITAGGSANITVTARDSAGAPIPGVLVVLSASGTGNTLVQPTALTDGAGEAVGTLSSTVAEAKQIHATAAGIPLTSAAVLVVDPGPPDASTTTAKVPVNGNHLRVVNMVITTRDAYGNGLLDGGFANQISVVVGGTNAGELATVTDNNDGTYKASYLALRQGNDQIAITLAGQPIVGSPFPIKIK